MEITHEKRSTSHPRHSDRSFFPEEKRGIRKGANGFTLIEIILVLLLLGILGGMAGYGIVQIIQGYMFTRENVKITSRAQIAMSRITREIVEMTDITAAGTSTVLSVDNVRGGHVLGLNGGAVRVATGGTALAGGDILVDNVASLTFAYIMADGTPSSTLATGDIGLLSAIDVTLELARADGAGSMEFYSRIAPRNIGQKQAGGGGGGTTPLTPPTAPSYGLCFVAEAAWGDGAHPMVVLLRDFRDHFLLTWGGGKRLVSFYHTHGPTAAALIKDRPHAMRAVRGMLYPVAAATFLLLYAPMAMGFLVLGSMVIMGGILSVLGRKREKAMFGLTRQKGSVLIGVIVTMGVVSVLGAAMLPMFSTSVMTQVHGDAGRKAYFLAESGYRYAAGEYLKATGDTAKLAVMDGLHGTTFNLLGNGGAFTLEVYPYWFQANSTSVDATSLSATAHGALPPQFSGNFGAGEIRVGNRSFSYTGGTGSGTTVTFTLSSALSAPPIAAGTDVMPVARPAAGGTFSKNGNLTLSSVGIDSFPLFNGNFTLASDQSKIYNYKKRSGNTLQSITLADPVENQAWTTSVSVDTTTQLILGKYLQLSSTGTFGNFSREVIYNVPVGWIADGPKEGFKKEEFHDKFDSGAAWFTEETLGGHAVSGGVMQVTGMANPGTSGTGLTGLIGALVRGWLGVGSSGSWAAVALNWGSLKTNLAKSWMDSGGCLSYDIQVKVNNTQPYFFAGLGFRMRNNSNDSDLHTYGVSFVRQRETRSRVRIIVWFDWTSWSFDDDINPALRPYPLGTNVTSAHTIQTVSGWFGTEIQARYSEPAIILWQRTGPSTGTGQFKRLAHRTISTADGITAGTETALRINPWSTLMVRLIEGYELQFIYGRVDNDGRHLKYGDLVQNLDGSKTARIVGTPIVTTNWGGAGTTAAAGRMMLTNVTGGGFNSGEDIYIVEGGGLAYASAAAAQESTKSNHIMVYYSDNKTPAAGNTVQADNTRIGNQRDYANWPPDDWTDRTAGLPSANPPGNDYLTLVQWPSLDTTADGQGNTASYVPALSGTDFHQAVVKTSALTSPPWTSTSTAADFLNPGDHISLITSSSAGTSTQYDDFAIQLDVASGTGFLPPIQQ